jgi:hypothetical protein
VIEGVHPGNEGCVSRLVFELVAGSVDRQQGLVQFGAAGEFARCLVDEDLIAPGCGQRVVLGLRVLVACGHPGIADPHGRECIANP